MPKFLHTIDMCANIATDKPFEELTRAELILAVGKRLESLAKEKDTSTDDFGHVETIDGDGEEYTFSNEEQEEIESLSEEEECDEKDEEEETPDSEKSPGKVAIEDALDYYDKLNLLSTGQDEEGNT